MKCDFKILSDFLDIKKRIFGIFFTYEINDEAMRMSKNYGSSFFL
jgi:hypothetical protein